VITCINLRLACLISVVFQLAGGSDSQQSKGIVPLSSLSKEQMLAYVEAEGTWLEKPSSELIILTYNVWFREDLELQARMDAIGDIILQHRPHIIFFQVLMCISLHDPEVSNSFLSWKLLLLSCFDILENCIRCIGPVGNSSERSAPKVWIGITSSRALVDWLPQELFLFKRLSVLGVNL
jgi:hypothetical protein